MEPVSSPRDHMAWISEEEPVEPPSSSNPILPRPGYPWQSQDLGPGTPGEAGMDALYVLVHELRRDVLLELKSQQEVTKEILARLTSPTYSAPARGFRAPTPLKSLQAAEALSPVLGAAAVQQVSTKSPTKSPPSSPVHNKDSMSMVQHEGSNSATETTPVEAPNRRSQRISIMGKGQHLFSTFSHYDLALQDVAERVEGARTRMMFHGSNLPGLDEEDKVPLVQRIVHTHAFDLVCALVVMSNSVFLGVEVEMGISNPGEISAGIQIAQWAYTAFFCLELTMRIGADGWQIFCNSDWMWGWLDALIVAISIWEVTADVIYALDRSQKTGVDGVSSLKALRIVRITRIIKVARLMRVFRFVMAFRTLITSIAFTLKSLFWALMLLFVIVYVFAVLFAQAVNDYITDPDAVEMPPFELERAHTYYSSLTDTMLSLFMCIANGVNWEQVIAPLKIISPAWVLLFLFYVSFTYFAVLNVVTGVFCQSAIESAQNDHATMVQSILKNKEIHIAKIQALFQQLGTENTGVITFNNFTEKINTPAVRAYFELLGLDVWDAWSFFKILDMDDSGDVEVEEFLMGCLRTRGNAKGIDVGKLIHDQTWLIKNQGKFANYVEKAMENLNTKMNELSGVCKKLLLSVEHPPTAPVPRVRASTHLG